MKGRQWHKRRLAPFWRTLTQFWKTTKKSGHFSVSGFLNIVKLKAYANVLACFVIFDFKLPALFL